MLVRLIILATLLWAGLVYPLHGELGADGAPAEAEDRSSVLVLYPDEGEYAALGELHAVNIANLAGRHAEAALAAISEYEADDRDGHDALIVVNSTAGQTVPEALVEDALDGEGETIWIGNGESGPGSAVASLTAQVGWLAEQATTEAFDGVVYRGEEFEREAGSTYAVAEIEVTDPDRVEVLAELRGTSGDVIPWAVRSDNLTFVTESPMPFASEDDRYLVFADILSRLLAPDIPDVRYALLRIEDIGPESDPVQLRAMSDALRGLGIPFAATVYDTFADPNGHFSDGHAREFMLADRPHVARALREMARAGGTLIMHGHTHQHRDMPNPHYGTSGGDYEFFLAGLDDTGMFDLIGPTDNDNAAVWSQRIAQADANWELAGLPPPWAFTTPHYAGSAAAYEALGDRFPARFERVLYFAGEARGSPDYTAQYNDQFFPYPVRDIRGDVILPETLGNWAEPGSIHGRTVEDILASARRNLVLREAYAGFFYHWYLSPEQMLEIATGLQEMGYEFVSPQVAAAVLPPRQGEPPGGRIAAGVHAYWDSVGSFNLWLRDHIELMVLLAIGFAHLVIFRIGPRRRRYIV